MSHRLRTFLVACTVLAAMLAIAAPASASKQVISYFGTADGSGSRGGEFVFPRDIAVNVGGAGPGGAGDVYVADQGNHRIQRFAFDDNDTPGDRYDDRYEFVGAWGSDVVTPGGAGDRGDESDGNYEICTVSAECKAGNGTDGNRTAGGNGSLNGPVGVTVDEDTGDVYVADRLNLRVSVYTGDGTFLRSFGWDVVESGPGDTGSSYEACVASDGDICKAGVAGAATGQIGGGAGFAVAEAIAVSPSDGDPGSGRVFVSDAVNSRVNSYGLDGSSPSWFGSATEFPQYSPRSLAVDSRGIVYAEAGGSEIARYDTTGVNAAGIGFLAPIAVPPLLSEPRRTTLGLAVRPDEDGAGPEGDELYVVRRPDFGKVSVQQFGPVHAPGLIAPPTTADDVHGGLAQLNDVEGIGVDKASGRLFVSSRFIVGEPTCSPTCQEGPSGVYVLDIAGGLPDVSLDSLDDVTATGATAHGSINPNGGPPVSYRLEHSVDGVNWMKGPTVLLGTQETPQAIDSRLEPAGSGLDPGTTYQVRLSVSKAFTPPVVSSSVTFTTLGAPPNVETVGSPVVTATTALLEGRVDPRSRSTSYRFEYGSEGPCATSPCQSTEAQPAGSGREIVLVARRVSGLRPGTTYHYRLVADNGDPQGAALGSDLTLTTRSSDDPPPHGEFPGPSGSDRAWEQVSVADAGGNPVLGSLGASRDGKRVVYQITGGTPIGDSGSGFNMLFAERTARGWVSRQLQPSRSQVAGANWLPPFADDDLAVFTVNNFDLLGRLAIWRLRSDGPPAKLFENTTVEYGNFYAASDDGSRAVATLVGPADADHPTAAESVLLYDIRQGLVNLVSLLPGEQVPTCDIAGGGSNFSGALPGNSAVRTTHWLSADGRLAFFPHPGHDCAGANQLYMRDFDAAQTRLLSAPPLSGSSCFAALIKSTPDAAFFWTRTRLTADDTPPATCGSEGDGDVYRYDLAEESLGCVTCVVAGLDADVMVSGGLQAGESIGVAEDGSRVYFRSPNPLLPGAASPGVYRVDIARDDFAYVAPGTGTSVGDSLSKLNALTPDGAVLLFASDRPDFDPLGGLRNGGTLQLYRYDDRDRSLVCVSCPQDGSPPEHPVVSELSPIGQLAGVGPNVDPLSDDGGVVAFATPNALVPADQNTAGQGQGPFAGTDVYEWRDGRVLLVSDGITSWPQESVVPTVNGVSPSGRDVFFTASAQLTPDALDGYNRLYDARIGGGIEFPEPPPPCPLEVCQGIPEGAPADPAPASIGLRGRGNVREGSSCASSTRLARRLARRTKRLSAAARRAQRRGAPPRRVRLLRRKARRLGGAAKKRRRAAARCRIAQLRRER